MWLSEKESEKYSKPATNIIGAVGRPGLRPVSCSDITGGWGTAPTNNGLFSSSAKKLSSRSWLFFLYVAGSGMLEADVVLGASVNSLHIYMNWVKKYSTTIYITMLGIRVQI